MTQYKDFLIEKIKLLRWEPYSEEYMFEIQDLWESFSNPMATGGPADWIFEKNGLKKHVNAIT